jgi:hypothetical protein
MRTNSPSQKSPGRRRLHATSSSVTSLRHWQTQQANPPSWSCWTNTEATVRVMSRCQIISTIYITSLRERGQSSWALWRNVRGSVQYRDNWLTPMTNIRKYGTRVAKTAEYENPISNPDSFWTDSGASLKSGRGGRSLPRKSTR